MNLTRELLAKCLPFAKPVTLDKFLNPLQQTIERYEINTPERISSFLAQLAHESGSLRYVREIASGQAYEGRKDLGNTQPGDGPRYKGRGLIQITGRTNYKALSDAFQVDFIKEPEKLEEPLYAALSAGWFWNSRKLNSFADQNDFKKITKLINGGYNGLDDRLKHWERCKRALNIMS